MIYAAITLFWSTIWLFYTFYTRVKNEIKLYSYVRRSFAHFGQKSDLLKMLWLSYEIKGAWLSNTRTMSNTRHLIVHTAVLWKHNKQDKNKKQKTKKKLKSHNCKQLTTAPEAHIYLFKFYCIYYYLHYLIFKKNEGPKRQFMLFGSFCMLQPILSRKKNPYRGGGLSS